MKTCILVINCGSSSLKFAVIDALTRQAHLTGLAERLNDASASLTFRQGETRDTRPLEDGTHAGALHALIGLLEQAGLLPQIAAIGHRVVHGGEHFQASVLIDEAVIAQIEKCAKLAPLHNPAHLIGIRTALECFPGLPQAATFDTAFHQTMPEHAYYYAVPMALYREHGVRRYGFHGTSYRYVSQEAARILDKPPQEASFVCAHLGNGASVAAIRQGKSVDTTMGLTPLEGLVMGTRSGDVDPGLFGHLANECGMTAQEINDLLNKRSGLLGLSGLSSDCRELEQAAAEGHEGARIALEKFCYRLAKHLAGQLVAAGPIDALLFTGGIGENSAWVRARAVAWLEHFGFRVDASANAVCVRGQGGFIHAEGSTPILVINTNEELMIALDAAALAGVL
ncbi:MULTISPECIES: acetate kinase [Gulbenkiania]|uniref:Acetate kinase n=1 Tax=Gulbenkiania indica TaxID=375574 RepID=A0A0K6H657_9NEIS|nr:MULTISPECIES: acetate kinase [Gulbenkiania]CUA86318.1 acetate kinase [Gulbenkiania indica]